MSIETLPYGLILAFSAISMGVCVVLSWRSLPSRLRAVLDEAVGVALEARRTAELVEARWSEEKIRLQTLVEALEDLKTQVEKKRARAVSAEHRVLEQQPLQGEDLKTQLRRQAGLI